MIDRIQDLKKFMYENAQIGSEEIVDPDQQYGHAYQDEGIDDDFFQDIKTVREMIVTLNQNNYKIQTLKGKYAKAIKATQEKASSDEMNKILIENSELQQAIRQKIGDIKDRVDDAEKNEPSEPETKMKRNFYLSLSKEITDVLQKQQTFEDQFKITVKDKVKRQVKLIDQNIDDEEAEQYAKHPQKAQQLLEQRIIGKASMTLKNTVCDIQDKFRDIQRLEASVNQCVELFQELSALVMKQGQKIDSIEANVADAKDYVQKAQQKLQQAKEHHKWSKKCKCIAIIVGLIILIIVIIVVVATSSNSSGA